MAVAVQQHQYVPQKRKLPFFVEPILLLLTFLLVCFSLVMVYSTTGVVSQEKFGDAFYYVKRQGGAALIGSILLVIAARVRSRSLLRIAPYCLPIAICLLLLTFIPGLGDNAGGAQRWLNLGIIRFQPGEIVKLLTIIFMAGYFQRQEKRMESFLYGVCIPMAFFGMVAVLLLLQPDFGSSAIIAIVTLAMCLAGGARLAHFAFCGIALLGCAAPLVILSPYRFARVVAFLDPFRDASGKGYQLVQSLIAVGSGRFSGVGLGQSQQKLFFLPAAHTDFIFGVIAEELGFLGALALIAMFLLILWRGMQTAKKVSQDTFRFCLAVGLTLLIVAPALLNVGVVTGILPTKGMVLPLVGYGGSSLIVSLTTVGLLLSIARDFYRSQHE